MSANLVLPIAEDEIKELLARAEVTEWFSRASAAQTASVILLQQLPRLVERFGRVDQKVRSALVELLNGVHSPQDLQYLRNTAITTFRAPALRASLQVLPSSGVSLTLPNERRLAPLPVLADGSWNPEYSETILAHRNPSLFSTKDSLVGSLNLSDPQGRAIQKLISEPGESMNLQGYPGSGKTHLIQTITDVLPTLGGQKTKILLLALTKVQLTGLLSKLNARALAARTFGHLAMEILSAADLPCQWPPGRRSNSDYQVRDRDIAERLGFQSVAGLAPSIVAKTCRRTVMSFCRSAAETLSSSHLPTMCDRFTPADRVVLISYSWKLWQQTIEPAPGEAFLPVRTFHLIKYASLIGGVVPDFYTHVLVDESHDLSPAMMQILDNSSASVLTLGDKFQRLYGTVPGRRQAVRNSDLDLVMRSGKAVEDVLNPLIEAHPFASQEPPLRATDRVDTVCDFYDRPNFPESPCTILVGGDWHLFEYFQRLSHYGATFALLPGAAVNFKAFVDGLLDLYYLNHRSNYPFLFRYPDWDTLSRECHHIRAFQRIESMLAKGYDRKDFANSLAKLVPIDQARFKLGRVDDARNYEFDSVMLTPELLVSKAKAEGGQSLATVLSRLYVGASRARHRIILPGHLKDWLSDSA